MKNKTWTKEEMDYMYENYKGKVNVKKISIELNRSVTAIKARATKMGIGKWLEHQGYLTGNNVREILDKDPRAMAKLGLKFTKVGFFNVIKFENFVKWLKNNQDKWDSRKVEEYGLGVEPQWLKEKRKIDSSKPIISTKWTQKETEKLIAAYLLGKTVEEIAKEINRTCGGVNSKIVKLKSINKLPKKRIILKWTEEETKMLLELEKQNKTDIEIAYELGRDKIHIVDKRRNMRNRGLYTGMKGDKDEQTRICV